MTISIRMTVFTAGIKDPYLWNMAPVFVFASAPSLLFHILIIFLAFIYYVLPPDKSKLDLSSDHRTRMSNSASVHWALLSSCASETWVLCLFNRLNRLQIIQNAAARLLTGTSRSDLITPVFPWLPVTFRNYFKILVPTFGALHGQAPLDPAVIWPIFFRSLARNLGQGPKNTR